MKIMVFLFFLLFSFSSFAQEQVPEKKYECSVEKQRIIHDLEKDVECVHDEECGYYNYGYPWQPDPCIMAIVNVKKVNHNALNNMLIEEYNNRCIYNNPEEKKKRDEFSKLLETAVCEDPIRVYCYKGFCRTQGYAIYNDE